MICVATTTRNCDTRPRGGMCSDSPDASRWTPSPVPHLCKCGAYTAGPPELDPGRRCEGCGELLPETANDGRTPAERRAS